MTRGELEGRGESTARVRGKGWAEEEGIEIELSTNDERPTTERY
jgi:hypothetical protein